MGKPTTAKDHAEAALEALDKLDDFLADEEVLDPEEQEVQTIVLYELDRFGAFLRQFVLKSERITKI